MKPYTQKIIGTDAKFDMVPIRGGKFLMGSPESEADRKEDEGPQFEAEVEPFWMGKCEVTWDEYALWGLGTDKHRRDTRGIEAAGNDKLADAITQPTPPYSDMSFGMGKEKTPAISMTQLAAKMYCKWLSAKTGYYYRLPTEAEWEYACRAGTTTAFCSGDSARSVDAFATHADNGSGATVDAGGGALGSAGGNILTGYTGVADNYAVENLNKVLLCKEPRQEANYLKIDRPRAEAVLEEIMQETSGNR